MVRKSTPRSSTFTRTLPTLCAASVWNRIPREDAIFASAEISWIVPTSLFECMIVTSAVFGVIAFSRSAGSTMSVFINGQIRYRISESFKIAARLQDGGMLDL